MADNFTFEILNAAALTSVLARAGAGVTGALASTLYAEANDMMREAKEQIPFRTGTAKGSGRVFPPAVVGNTVYVDMGFGGAASDYVEILHENARGASFMNGKKDHYLSDPVTQLSTGLGARILDDIGRFM